MISTQKIRDLGAETGISGKKLLELSAVLSRLAELFLDFDATLVEINPLAITHDGQFIASDCHLEIDDDAIFRHKDLLELTDEYDRSGVTRKKTAFKSKAEKIDSLDHRGVAGRVIEFDGSLGLITPDRIKLGMAGGPVEHLVLTR